MPFNKLLDGYKSFREDYYEKEDLLKELAAKGQNPDTLVIACCDSRSDPALLTNSKPGDLFVVRNVAAIVPPYKSDNQHHGTSAAIEFAVQTLKVKNIVVLGHSQCGGIGALSDRETCKHQYEFLTPWMDIGIPALNAVEQELPNASPDIRRRALEQAVVLVSLDNLMTFPWIASAVAEGRLRLHGWYFEMHAGKMMTYSETKGIFEEALQAKVSNT